MSRYAIQWIIFVLFCTGNVWLWFGDELKPLWTSTQPATQNINAQPSTDKTDTASGPDPVRLEEPPEATPPNPPSVAQGPAQSETDRGLARMDELLSSGKYEEAVELYSTVYTNLSEAESEDYQKAIFLHEQNLISEGNRAGAIDLLEQYVGLFYKDLRAQSLLADLHHLQRRYPDEIAALLTALDQAIAEDEVRSLRKRLSIAIESQAGSLETEYGTSAVVDFYRELAANLVDYPPAQLGFARALIETGDIEQAVDVLNLLPPDPAFADETSQLLDSIEQRRLAETIAIPIRRIGESFLVDAVINGNATVTLLIDTGASMTTIRPAALQSAGINLRQAERTIVFTTANGKVTAPVLRLASLALGSKIINDIEVAGIHLFGLDEIDGLLGMNFLNNFKFTLNQQEQVIVLSR